MVRSHILRNRCLLQRQGKCCIGPSTQARRLRDRSSLTSARAFCRSDIQSYYFTGMPAVAEVSGLFFNKNSECRSCPSKCALAIKKAGAGIEPANSGFADRDLTTWLPRRFCESGQYRCSSACIKRRPWTHMCSPRRTSLQLCVNALTLQRIRLS